MTGRRIVIDLDPPRALAPLAAEARHAATVQKRLRSNPGAAAVDTA